MPIFNTEYVAAASNIGDPDDLLNDGNETQFADLLEEGGLPFAFSDSPDESLGFSLSDITEGLLYHNPPNPFSYGVIALPSPQQEQEQEQEQQLTIRPPTTGSNMQSESPHGPGGWPDRSFEVRTTSGRFHLPANHPAPYLPSYPIRSRLKGVQQDIKGAEVTRIALEPLRRLSTRSFWKHGQVLLTMPIWHCISMDSTQATSASHQSRHALQPLEPGCSARQSIRRVY